MPPTLESAISVFGSTAHKKLSNPTVSGQPEDQLRGPFEQLLQDLAQLCNFASGTVVSVGESSVSDLKTRPDFAVTVRGALVGFVELKAPGKGADPRKFRDPHDRAQWQKLRSLPNLIYSDGNSFCLCQNGEVVGKIIHLDGDVETSGKDLAAPSGLLAIFESFFLWEPIAPRNARELAQTTARLCRLLRDEVAEQLNANSPSLTALAKDWRMLLFPDATDERFADGYAQAVAFGLLMARAKEIPLATGLQQVADELENTNSLIGAALGLLTHDTSKEATLKTSLGTLTCVLDAVNWAKVSKNKVDAWLYFYEDFLEIYDNDLRKKTGSYYTPPEVVSAMVELVDQALRSRFGKHNGLASESVTLCDPATGTGTFILGALRRIAETVKADEGEGAVAQAVDAAINRLIAFEMQLGPFAVAQLRIFAELIELTGATPSSPVRMFVTDTLGDPYHDAEWIPSMRAPIGQSRRDANKIKREEPITVVIGNPPYKEKAKDRGSWVEKGTKGHAPLLKDWMPPADWGVGAHAKHLRNLYIYFWRWATWKVYDHHPEAKNGIVCFITVAGFLNGPGFQRMRDYLRRTCDDIWVIDCSPEGHQPEVNTRIFEGVQQPVCIVLASRSANSNPEVPAKIRFHSLPPGRRAEKFSALAALRLTSAQWQDCPSDWRAPFLPESSGSWSEYPALDDLFVYNGSGVMPGRTWVIAPDADALINRWNKLISAEPAEMDSLFHPHLSNGKLGDRYSERVVAHPLPRFESRPEPISRDKGPCVPPVRYGFRSFDRQWIIPDNRVINRPNPTLWEVRSHRQVYLTVLSRTAPSSGPALTITGLVPDLDHYNGRGGRTFPLWSDGAATQSNLRPRLTACLAKSYDSPVSSEDLIAYIACVTAHPAFTNRFRDDLSTPGLRVPITKETGLFSEAAAVGRSVIWLHTFGERMADPSANRPSRPPRLPKERMPHIPKEGAIPADPASMPDSIDYDASKRRLLVGRGYIENVDPAVWAYEVSGKQVLLQWFSYRKKDRSRPIIGDRRKPSPLGDIQPDHWLAEYTTELINVLNVLALLVDLEPVQADLLTRICDGPTISADDLSSAGALDLPSKKKEAVKYTLLDDPSG